MDDQENKPEKSGFKFNFKLRWPHKGEWFSIAMFLMFLMAQIQHYELLTFGGKMCKEYCLCAGYDDFIYSAMDCGCRGGLAETGVIFPGLDITNTTSTTINNTSLGP